MITHNDLPGTPAWHARRGTCFNASDAPAMLGCSPHETRAQLIARLHSGVHKEFGSYAQERIIDPGHEYEAKARPLAETIIGDDLVPLGGSQDFGLSRPLGASFDGLTMLGDTAWEHKRMNADLRYDWEKGNGFHLPKHYQVQLEQQLMVSGAERVLFMATAWTGDTCDEQKQCWYASDPKLRAEILAGWKQFDADLAAYVPSESTPAAVAAPIEALPAISARIEGSLAVHSNLDAFGAALRAFIAKIPEMPTSDQEFADCDAACKALKKAEEALDGAEANALGQVHTVETLTRTIADLRNIARTARLASEKVVKARKEQIRVEEVQRGQKALAGFTAGLNATIGKPYMPAIPHDFGGAISGKKTLESLRAAIDQHLADKKIEASAVCARIVVNLRNLRELAEDRAFLFADTAQLVLKAEDDCRAVIDSRIAAHQAEEKRRAEAAAEKERDRIRAEEQAKAEREARERIAAEQRAQVPVATQAPVAAPAAPPAVSSKAPAANSPSVVPIARGKPTLRLGQINERISPLAVTAAGLESLGFKAAGKEGASVLFHEADFGPMVDSLVAHLRMAQQRVSEPVAA